MRVYREFIVDENTRSVQVRCIDESTCQEVAGLASYRFAQSHRLEWTLLAQPSSGPEHSPAVNAR
jgi:hypothetical protein